MKSDSEDVIVWHFLSFFYVFLEDTVLRFRSRILMIVLRFLMVCGFCETPWSSRHCDGQVRRDFVFVLEEMCFDFENTPYMPNLRRLNVFAKSANCVEKLYFSGFPHCGVFASEMSLSLFKHWKFEKKTNTTFHFADTDVCSCWLGSDLVAG